MDKKIKCELCGKYFDVHGYHSHLDSHKNKYKFLVDDDGKIGMRYRNKRANAKKEGIECELSFEEYCKLVYDAGIKSSQLGFKGSGYVLARYNDEGNYKVGNCRFITQKENAREKKIQSGQKNCV